MTGFTEEELDEIDRALAPFEGKIAEGWAKRRESKPRMVDERAKPTRAQLRRHELATQKNADFWKNWEPK
jgi:hypothetical protein